MIPVSYDLHLHSCLSPCGDDDMTPANIIGMAAVKELDVIALTDHNSCLNCPALMELGSRAGITVIPGMELTTEEEVHVVCLFPRLDAALEFDSIVASRLLRVSNRPEIFGHQYIMDTGDGIKGEVSDLLINATSIGFSDIPGLIAPLGGVMIPAHLDKSTTSLISNLGFVPPESTFSVFEVKDLAKLHALRRDYPYLAGCNVITDSDAHYLWDINEPVNTLHVHEKSIEAVLDALTAVLPAT